jgi:hypothetical protein
MIVPEFNRSKKEHVRLEAFAQDCARHILRERTTAREALTALWA